MLARTSALLAALALAAVAARAQEKPPAPPPPPRPAEAVRTIESLEAEARACEERGDAAGACAARFQLGNAHSNLGEFPEALRLYESSLKVAEECGQRSTAASAIRNMGLVHTFLGDYASGLQFGEEALRRFEDLKDPHGTAWTLKNLGTIHRLLGDGERALELQRRALRLEEESGNESAAVLVRSMMGSTLQSLQRFDEARELEERALRWYEEKGERYGQALVLGFLGNIEFDERNYARAVERQEQSVRLWRELGNRESQAGCLVNIAAALYRLAEYPRALEVGTEARALSAELGLAQREARALAVISRSLVRMGRAREGAKFAREGVERTFAIVRGVGDTEGAKARGSAPWNIESGVLAAIALADPAEASFFLESGRAGALLEMLSLRERLRGAAVPAALEEALDAARCEETTARKRLGAARQRGAAEEAAAEGKSLEAAQRKVAEALERIQREAKAAASVTYPRADELPEIRRRLRPGEAVVTYGKTEESYVAVVATAREARLVPLGPPGPIEEACAALALEDGRGDPSLALDALRALVVAPLGLGPNATRILVSPAASLSQVPFALLLGDRETACVPSGTTHGILLDGGAVRGDGVLALGDAECAARPQPGVVASLRAGVDLGPLPATREEAKAVGTTVLVGKEATVRGLRDALAGRPRWKAVHLACHGLLDSGNADRSALALSATAEDDGLLTVLDVFRMKVPADLVVLSACETGRGRFLRGEGVMGLARAFMYAGAPRVLVSLWKVDDEATKALMVKFYELWNPKDGSKGLGAAAALKKAQEFVAGQEKWKHPRYWAAWVLWGLPE